MSGVLVFFPNELNGVYGKVAVTVDAERDPDVGGADPTEWNSPEPVDRDEGTGRNAGNAIQFRWWNLLLLLPLLMLVTPIFNKNEPRLFGLPVFYWYQFGFVFVGVAAVAIVYVATKDPKKEVPPTPGDRDTRDGAE